jgi:hypothetical protein
MADSLGRKTGGRQKGTLNKLTSDVKDMIVGALSDAGGRKYLLAQAIEHPAAFMTLVGKVLPLQVSGEGGGPVIFQSVKFGDGDDDPPAA